MHAITLRLPLVATLGAALTFAPLTIGSAHAGTSETVAPPEGAEAPVTAEPGGDGDAAADPSSDPDPNDAEQLSGAAVTAFNDGDFETAADLFEKAYAVDPDPNYLFNIGRVYEELGNIDKAIEFYERFVGERGVALESRQFANERLKVLKEIQATTKEPEEQPEGPVDPTEPEPEPEPEDEGPTKKQKTFRLTGGVLLGVGGAALITGGVLGGLASGQRNEAEDLANPLEERLQAKSDAEDLALGADISFAAGGALAVTGAVLLVLGFVKKDNGAKADKAAFAPSIGRDRAGLVMQYRF